MTCCSNSRSIAMRLWAMILAMFVALGCAGSHPASSAEAGPGSAASPGSAPTAGVSSAPASAMATACSASSDAAAMIKASAAAQLAAPSYRAETVLTRHDGGRGTSVIEYQAPDRLHVTFTSPELGQTTELIQIGGGSWLKINGRWTKSPAIDIGEILGIARQLTDAARIANTSLVGNERIGSDDAAIYHFTADFSGNMAVAKSDAKLWVRTADCLPLTLESLVTTNAPGATGTEQVVETFSKWGEVSIEAPA